MDVPRVLRAMFDAAIAAADPATVLAEWLPEPPKGRTVVIGGGKAAASMAAALERACEKADWPGPLTGTVVTRYGHAVPTQAISVREAAHPVPDQAGMDGAGALLDAITGLTADDLVICLMSGGASALLTLPAGRISLEDKQAVNRALLKSGATIGQMNTVRRHLSEIKGGRLAAAAAPARVVTLAISDVPGDGPGVIGSGPTVPDATTRADARAVLDGFGIKAPQSVTDWLARPESETPDATHPAFAATTFQLIATPQRSLEAAAAIARQHELAPIVLGDAIEGEARDVGTVHAGIAHQIARHSQPARAPAVLLSGGETTVTVRGAGRGGRNVEFLLALAIALDGHGRISAIAGDTDGIDGIEDHAGAIVTPDTLKRARAQGLDPTKHLAENDAYTFFKALGDLVVTGPTLTNVNDFRAVIVDATNAP